MFWIKRHHVVAAILASVALLISVIVVGEPLNTQRVKAATVSVGVSGGTLSTHQRVEFVRQRKTQQGTDVFVVSAPTQVGDARGTGEGWYLTISHTGLRTLGSRVGLRNYKMTVEPAPEVKTVSGKTPPLAFGGSIDGVGSTLARAEEGSGMGLYEITPVLDITAPRETASFAVLETTIVQTFVSAH